MSSVEVAPIARIGNCECSQKPSTCLTKMSDHYLYNVTAEVPKDLYMKRAGSDSNHSDRGLGIFNTRACK